MCTSERERRFKAFDNRNSLVADPAAEFLAEDAVRPWTEDEKRLFLDKFIQHPKVPSPSLRELFISQYA